MILKRKPFVPNNLELRQLSSMCISKYKESQAFALAELGNSQTHEFSKTAKEILLLKYDTWFRWLVEVEDVLRRKGREDSVADVVMLISDDLEKEYTETLLGNPEVFSRHYVDVWLKSHRFMYGYLRKKIHLLTSEDINAFMIEVTNVLISVMDNTLFELHEIDSLYYGRSVFLSFDDICTDYTDVLGKDACLLADRLAVYQEFFHISDKAITIKDYSREGLMSTDCAESRMMYLAVRNAGFRVKAIV